MHAKSFVTGLIAVLLLLFPLYAGAVPDGYTRAGAAENVFFYGDRNYLVEYPYDIRDKFAATVREYTDNYNEFLSGDDTEVYLYFVNNSRSVDFTAELSGPNPIFREILGMLTCVDYASCLEIDSFDTYMDLFYQTDHHWNHKGAQRGYEDIIALLCGEDEGTLQPAEEIVFDTLFNGSYTLRAGVNYSDQPFAVYRYDLPEITLTVNGKKKSIGRMDAYFSGKYKKDSHAPHFETFYGGDWGELVFDTGLTDRDNLLILCNSYGCSVRYLISYHFNKSYVVDMREYMSQTGHGMKLREYLKEHDIHKVLILGDVSLFLYGKMFH